MDGFETLEGYPDGKAPARPGRKTLTIALAFLLPALLGVVAACLAALGPRGADGGAETPAAPRKDAVLERPHAPLAGAWHPCGSWHTLPGFDRGCVPA